MAGWLALSTDGCVLLAWQISEQTMAPGTVTERLCGCLPLRCWDTEIADQTSVFHRHAPRQVALDTRETEEKSGLHLGHYNGALGCVILNLCARVHVSSYFVSREAASPESHEWLADLQRQLGNFRKNERPAALKHETSYAHSVNISFIVSLLWFQNQYQISARILSARWFFFLSSQLGKTKLLHLICTATLSGFLRVHQGWCLCLCYVWTLSTSQRFLGFSA